MTAGKRIRFIRTFQGMTQKELKIALGFDAGSADIRVSQYEFDNPLDVMESFFWFEEEFPLQIILYEFKTDKNIDMPSMKIPAGTNGAATESPIAVMFALPEYRKCIKEW